MAKKLNILGEECYLMRHEYAQGGRLAIEVVCANDGEPYCVATVNAPEVKLRPGEVILKNRDGQETAIEAMMQAGIVSRPVGYAQLGWVKEPIVRVNENVLAEYLVSETEELSTGESV